VTDRRLSSFIDALAAGRRPRSFRAGPEDVGVLRTAIDLRAARPGDAVPDEQFVSNLYEELAEQAGSSRGSVPRPMANRRRRVALVSVAAALTLVGGTAAVTETVDRGALTPAAVQAPHGNDVRTGTFETANSRVMGQLVAYGGNPSWVYMNVDIPNYDGAIVCKLQVGNGSTVAVGAFELHNGTGEWTKTIRVDVGRLRGAKLVTTTGGVVASATLA
jgi:hypothetical protein